MELAFLHEDLDFRAEAQSFIDRHWPPHTRGPGNVRAGSRGDRGIEVQAWFDALVARGWSVPNWPLEHGGSGWSATQKYIWSAETAAAQVPQMCQVGVNVVGPAICGRGSAGLQAQFLPAIREARTRWCQGSSGVAPVVVCEADKLVVNGVVHTVGGQRADWMICRAATQESGDTSALGLLLVDMRRPGIRRHAIETLDGCHTASSVALCDVQMPVAHLLELESRNSRHTGTLEVARVAAARVQLDRVAQVAGQTPDGDASVAEDEAFQGKYRELEVLLLGLESLELRILAGVAGRSLAVSQTTTFERILEIRINEIGQRIAELMVETLGYYALPYPDSLRFDNEGAVGHEYARSSIQSWLTPGAGGMSGFSGAGFSSEVQKSIIARSALELPTPD